MDYYKSTTASSLFRICQWVWKQTKLLPGNHSEYSPFIATSREKNSKKVYPICNRRPHRQCQRKSTNFSTNQVRLIPHCNISWNSGNWIYKLQQNHIRTYSINKTTKFTVRYNWRYTTWKFPNTELFLVQIQENTDQKKLCILDTSQAVIIWGNSKLR